MGRVQVATTLLDLLPSELANISEPEEQATEYLHYRQFFVIWETAEQVVEVKSRDVPGLSREKRMGWVQEYAVSGDFVLGCRELGLIQGWCRL